MVIHEHMEAKTQTNQNHSSLVQLETPKHVELLGLGGRPRVTSPVFSFLLSEFITRGHEPGEGRNYPLSLTRVDAIRGGRH